MVKTLSDWKKLSFTGVKKSCRLCYYNQSLYPAEFHSHRSIVFINSHSDCFVLKSVFQHEDLTLTQINTLRSGGFTEGHEWVSPFPKWAGIFQKLFHFLCTWCLDKEHISSCCFRKHVFTSEKAKQTPSMLRSLGAVSAVTAVWRHQEAEAEVNCGRVSSGLTHASEKKVRGGEWSASGLSVSISALSDHRHDWAWRQVSLYLLPAESHRQGTWQTLSLHLQWWSDVSKSSLKREWVGSSYQKVYSVHQNLWLSLVVSNKKIHQSWTPMPAFINYNNHTDMRIVNLAQS